MDDGDSKNNQQTKRHNKQVDATKRYGTDASSFLQSVWIRCRSIFPTVTDGKFMESELRIVLYCGLFFWSLYLLYEAIK